MNFTRGDFLYYVLKSPVKLYLKLKFNIQVESNPLTDFRGSYLLLGHHVTNFDPIISNAYASRLIRYIAGDANQDSWLTKFLLAILESIPFTKNRSDAKSIRKLVKHVEKGHPIGLYPEGGRNWDGATDTLIPSTAKLIKMLKLPVYATFYKGGYLSWPRWASYPRRGKMSLEIKQIIDEDTVALNSAEELYKLMVDKLSYNEFDWQAQNRVHFKGRNLAEHIERLLYICPNCLAVNSLQSKGDDFYCTDCKHKYTVNHFGEIQGCPDFVETVSWNKWQRAQLPRIIQEGFSFSSPDIVVEKVDLTQKTKERRRAWLTMSQDRLQLDASSSQSRQGHEIEGEIVWISDLSSLSVTFMDFAEFYVEKTKYRLNFDPRRHMSIKLFYDLLVSIKGGGL